MQGSSCAASGIHAGHHRKIRWRYVLAWTGIYTAAFLIVFSPFFLGGKSLIGMGDGESQYILHLRYTGEWLRENLRGLLQGDFHFGHYDFTIGMGDDINSVVRFHPLDLAAVFVPAAYTELLYNILAFVRCFLAGLSFSVWAFEFCGKEESVLAGALTYSFCGFSLQLGIVHPTFFSALILFPMMLLGAERMMDPERRHSFTLFSAAIAVSFISNYYFTCISSVGLLIYVLIRFFCLYTENRGRHFVRLLLSMTAAYLLGALIAGLVLLPSLMRYMGSARTPSGRPDLMSLLFYKDKRRYAAWFLNLITPCVASGNGTRLNFAVPVLPALAVLFSREMRKERRLSSLRSAAAASLICLLSPACGYVLAAMNSENNRWVYMISMVCAAAVTFTMEDLCRLNKSQRRLLAAVTLLFDAGAILYARTSGVWVFYLTAACEASALTAALCLIGRKAETELSTENGRSAESGPAAEAGKPAGEGQSTDRRRARRFILAVTVFSVSFGGYLTYSKHGGNLIRFYQDSGTALSYYDGSEYAIYTQVPEYTGTKNGVWDGGFYRVDGVRSVTEEDNAALYFSYPGFQCYNSILNSDIVRMMKEQQNLGMTSILHTRSLDGRTAAEEIAGVKYFAADDANSASLPYGYRSDPIVSRNGWSLYENEYPLAFGFSVDRTITRAEYDALTPAERERILLECAVAEDHEQVRAYGKSGGASAGQAAESLEETENNVREAAGEAQEMAAEAQKAAEADQATETAGQEAYGAVRETAGGIKAETLEIRPGEGITQDGNVYRSGGQGGRLLISYYSRKGQECYLQLDDLKLQSGGQSTNITILGDGISKYIMLSGDSSTYSRRMDGYLVKLDNGGEEAHSLTLLIYPNMSIRIGSAEALYLPLDGYVEKTGELNRNSLQNVFFGEDTVSGDAALPEPRYMVFQIPYSSGWTAEVNGRKIALDRADSCYLGLWLEEGRSHIVLTYHTPGLRTGALMSLAGLALYLAAAAALRRRRGAEGE